MKKKNLIKGLILLAVILNLTTSFGQSVIDDFTDGNFTSNQIWTGSTTEFSIITDVTLPNGIASTDGSYLASNASQGDVSLAFPSTEVSEWRFSLGSPDFNPSGPNYIGVVLMASASFSGDLINENVNNDFQGYYLRIGDNGTDPIAIYRKTGSGEEIVGNFPSSPSFGTGALQNGLNIRVTRSSSGVFELFYSTGFQNNSIPTTSAGTLTNTAYTTSSYFGVYQNIGNTSADRRVFIDNIELGVVNWDGSESSNWATAANWDTNSVPISTDNIIIPSFSNSYPSVTTIETINSVIIDSGATLVATNAGFSITNDAIYTRNLANGSRWYYISSPVVGETYNDAWATANSVASGQNNNKGLSWYDNTSYDTDTGAGDTETGYWRYLQSDDSNNGSFNVGQGYGVITSSSTTVTFIGTGINTSSQTRAITTDVSNFNMVGNPFTSFLNLGNFFVDNPKTTVLAETEAYFWNGSSYDTKTSGLHSTYEIAPGQGFFIEAAVDTNLTFDISDTNHLANTAEGADTFQKSSRPEIHLFLSDGATSRYSNIYYINGTTTGFDNGYDGKLFGGVSHPFALYTHLVSGSEGKHFQLQSLPKDNYENMVISIGINADAGKEITFSTEVLNLPTGLKVYLEDRETNTFTRLDELGNKYTIILNETSHGIGRFYLHTTESTLSSNTNSVFKNIRIYKTDHTTLRIIGLSPGKTTVKLFNMLGKQLLNSSFTTNDVHDISLPQLSTGIYLIQLESEKGTLNNKIILE